jgi:hypothetical protein
MSTRRPRLVEQTVSILFMCLDMICTIFHGLWYLVPLKSPISHTFVALLHLTCHLVLALFGPLAPHLQTLPSWLCRGGPFQRCWNKIDKKNYSWVNKKQRENKRNEPELLRPSFVRQVLLFLSKSFFILLGFLLGLNCRVPYSVQFAWLSAASAEGLGAVLLSSYDWKNCQKTPKK